MIVKYSILSVAAACALLGCSASDAPKVQADETVEIALKDVPENIKELVAATSADFKMVEVMKKRREGRIYYDVEGELPSGEDIEFDILMTPDGPKVVEVQRDIAWADTPQSVVDVVAAANIETLNIVRVIESKQAGTDVIIYEIFVEGEKSKPHFEVSVAGKAPASLLTTPSKH